ncbi:hypothetical protein KO498_06445 [Lentibacter algarum]|uniref:sensor histidine kinase n=1 Tax=Lentibacter algarum TaxID=576131 RepID=UPI001C065BC3|nr:ATP-binding protein [Lentibacter algarum]MBU2981451.1 hypothetical protein [Lentibacter algarum]
MIPATTAAQMLDRFENPVLVIDTKSLAICHMNLAALTLKQASQDSGFELTDLASWMGVSTEEARARLTSQRPSFFHEVNHGAAYFDVQIQPLSDSGASDQMFAFFHEITRRREVERKKQELVSTVSHELRSPMTAIKGAMGLLLAGSAGEMPERARNMIQIAQRNADRLILIVNDILDLDKIADGTMAFDNSEVRVADVIETAVEGIAGFRDRFDVSVTTEINAPDALSMIDPNRMVQVLVNLLSNAIKFSPAGGNVKIALSRHAGFNRISVADMGEGIPKDEQDLLFQRFVQIGAKNRAATGGTGLGLSIVQEILAKQDCKISFESEVGGGTTFFVDIPIYDGLKLSKQVNGSCSS